MSGAVSPANVAVAKSVQPGTATAIAASYTRHALTGVAGLLAGILVGHADAIRAGVVNFAVAHHWATQDQALSIVGGIGAVVALAWSAYQKKAGNVALENAVAAPAGKAVPT